MIIFKTPTQRHKVAGPSRVNDKEGFARVHERTGAEVDQVEVHEERQHRRERDQEGEEPGREKTQVQLQQKKHPV